MSPYARWTQEAAEMPGAHLAGLKTIVADRYDQALWSGQGTTRV